MTIVDVGLNLMPLTPVPPPGLGGLGLNEVQWETQGGAGWDVDCASPPIGSRLDI